MTKTLYQVLYGEIKELECTGETEFYWEVCWPGKRDLRWAVSKATPALRDHPFVSVHLEDALSYLIYDHEELIRNLSKQREEHINSAMKAREQLKALQSKGK